MLRMRKLLVLLVVVSVSMLTMFSAQNAFAKPAKKAQDKQEVQDKKEEMVYATSQGKKYHKEDCRFIKNREAQAIAKKEAEEKGLVACGKCYKENAAIEEETQEEKE